MYVAASDVPPPHGSAPDLDASEYPTRSRSRISVPSFHVWSARRPSGNGTRLGGRLRVCWNRRTRELNCGGCEKCIRTRMQLLVTGSPDGLGSFDAGPSLFSAVGDLSDVKAHLSGQWREIASALRDRRLGREVDRLLAGRKQPYWRRKLRQFGRNGSRMFRAALSRATAPRASR